MSYRDNFYDFFISDMKMLIDSIFKDSGWSTNDTKEWNSFMSSLCPVIFSNALRVQNCGNCREAAHEVVKLNLLNQLSSGNRETIHHVQLHGYYDHGFVVFGADTIKTPHGLPSDAHQGLEDWLLNLKQAHPNREIIISDPWMGYHGSVEKTFLNLLKKQFKNKEEQERLKNALQKIGERPPSENNKGLIIQANNFTMPELRAARDQDNPVFRRYIKELMHWLLTFFDKMPSEQVNPFFEAFLLLNDQNSYVAQLNAKLVYFENYRTRRPMKEPARNSHNRSRP